MNDKLNNYIGKFKVIFAPNLPALYGQGLTDYEILVRINKVIAECVDTVNSFYELAKKLDEALEDLDGYIKEEVKAVVEEMYNSGELKDIINEFMGEIANGIQAKNGNIDLSHMALVLHKAHNYGVVATLPDYSSVTVEEELYSALQGNTVFSIGGNKYWACCYVCQNGSVYDTNNGARLFVYTINQDGTMSYITDKEFSAVGHCNAMSYHNGYLYITPNSYAGTGGGYTTDVLRVSFDGSSLGGTDAGNNKYTMERKTPTGWLYVTNVFSDFISSDGEQLYICDGQMNVYTYDWESNVVTPIYERINGLDGYTGDGFSVTKDYIYMGARGYRIKRFNREFGVIDWVYQLPIIANNKQWKIGETEGFTVVDNVLYIAGFYNLCGISTKYNTYSVTHFYRQNLVTNNIQPTNTFNWSSGYQLDTATLYVNGNAPSDKMNPYNPDGSSANPFNCVQLALDYLESHYYLQRATIEVMQFRNLSTIHIRTTKPVTIRGTAYYTANNSLAVIGHIYISRNANVQIERIAINNLLPLSINNSYCTDNCIFFLGGGLVINNVAFPTGIVTNSINVKYALQVYNAIANVLITENYATTQSNWVTYRGQAGVSNAGFLSSANSTINGHGALVLTQDVVK